jgi:hypothetical protein
VSSFLLLGIPGGAGVVAVAVRVRDFSVAVVDDELSTLVLADDSAAIDSVSLRVGVDRSPFCSIPPHIPASSGVGDNMMFISSHVGLLY